MNDPLVSVVMCVRNGERFLRKALDSIETQSADGFEVILIDDGSTDATPDIARKHGLSITLVRQPPLGLSHALNSGLAAARGSFVAFIDSDDVWPKSRIQDLHDALSRDPEAVFIHGKLVNCDANLNPIAPPISTRMLTTAIIRKSAFDRVGSFRTDLVHAANVDWISRAVSVGLRFHSCPEIVLLRRTHGNNMGIVDKARGRDDLLKVIRDHHARTKL